MVAGAIRSVAPTVITTGALLGGNGVGEGLGRASCRGVWVKRGVARTSGGGGVGVGIGVGTIVGWHAAAERSMITITTALITRIEAHLLR